MSCADAHRPVLVRYPQVTGVESEPNVKLTFGYFVEVRCVCGFTAPPGVDSDEAVAYHIAAMLPVPQ